MGISDENKKFLVDLLNYYIDQADSYNQFAAVPEFPLGTGALLIISVSSYVLFTRSPEKVTNALTRCSKILSKQ